MTALKELFLIRHGEAEHLIPEWHAAQQEYLAVRRLVSVLAAAFASSSSPRSGPRDAVTEASCR